MVAILFRTIGFFFALLFLQNGISFAAETMPSDESDNAVNLNLTHDQLTRLIAKLTEQNPESLPPELQQLREDALASERQLSSGSGSIIRRYAAPLLIISGTVACCAILVMGTGSLGWTAGHDCERVPLPNSTCPADPEPSFLDSAHCPDYLKPCYCPNVTSFEFSSNDTRLVPTCNLGQARVYDVFSRSSSGDGFCCTEVPNIVDPACLKAVRDMMIKLYSISGGVFAVSFLTSLYSAWLHLQPANTTTVVDPKNITIVDPATPADFITNVANREIALVTINGDEESGYTLTSQPGIIAALRDLVEAL